MAKLLNTKFVRPVQKFQILKTIFLLLYKSCFVLGNERYNKVEISSTKFKEKDLFMLVELLPYRERNYKEYSAGIALFKKDMAQEKQFIVPVIY
jgi:hypothetical protein